MAFSEALKLSTRKRAHFRCCICRTIGVEIHHIVPQEEQGPDSEENAAPLCPSCHELYGANPTKRKFIREARDFWYELCAKESNQEGLTLSSLSDVMAPLATKDDLAELKKHLGSILQARGAAAVPQCTGHEFIPVPLERFIRSLYDEDFERQWMLYELLFDSRSWCESGDDSYDLLDRRALFLKMFGEETAHRVCLVAAKYAEFNVNGFTEENLRKVLHSVHAIVILVTQHRQVTRDAEAFECSVRTDGEFLWRAVPRKPKRSRMTNLKRSKAKLAED